MSPVISVVIPVFNGLPHIKDCLDSVLNQTHQNIEIVLVDGGSRDGSREWIYEQQDTRIKAMTMPHGTSAAENWNAASHEATGDYIKLLCQDDILYPNALTDQLADLDKHPQASFAVAQRDIVDANGKMLYRKRGLRGMKPGLTTGTDALRTSYLSGTNNFGEPVAILFRHEALDSVLNWSDDRPFLLDLDLYTKALQSQSLVVRTESIGAFRVSSSSWSTKLVDEQTQQLRDWQHEVAEILDPKPTKTEKLRASAALRQQTLLRRLAYRVLKLRGSFASGSQ
jgi:glycosyltransferase involved in cell wall biosynthesis